MGEAYTNSFIEVRWEETGEVFMLIPVGPNCVCKTWDEAWDMANGYCPTENGYLKARVER